MPVRLHQTHVTSLTESDACHKKEGKADLSFACCCGYTLVTEPEVCQSCVWPLFWPSTTLYHLQIRHAWGWPEPYINTVYDRIFWDFPAKINVYTLYNINMWFWPTLGMLNLCHPLHVPCHSMLPLPTALYEATLQKCSHSLKHKHRHTCSAMALLASCSSSSSLCSKRGWLHS